MERPQNISDKYTAKAIRLIIIFHLVGLVGLLIPVTRPLFLKLVPYHLLLMMVIVLFTHNSPGTKFAVFFILTFVAGFAVEWIGVHTSLIFGHYSYGNVLGLKLNNIPLIIGINWFLLIYATGVALQWSGINYKWLRIPAGALILVLLDLLIEPVAMRLDYWHWQDNIIPLKNYGCWFIISAALLLVFELMRFKKQSLVGVVLLVSQFIFFMALLSL